MKRSNIDINLTDLDYKFLQKKCKEYNLKAVGNSDILKTRLLDFFKNNNSNNSCNKEENTTVEEITTEIHSLNLMDEIKIEYIDPTTVSYTKNEMNSILQLGILSSNAIKNNLSLNTKLSINKILYFYSELIPECKIKTRRKVILINAIISLFQEEINNNKDNNYNTILDTLIENGKETLRNSLTKKVDKIKSK